MKINPLTQFRNQQCQMSVNRILKNTCICQNITYICYAANPENPATNYSIDQKFMSANAVQSFTADCEIYRANGHFN